MYFKKNSIKKKITAIFLVATLILPYNLTSAADNQGGILISDGKETTQSKTVNITITKPGSGYVSAVVSNSDIFKTSRSYDMSKGSSLSTNWTLDSAEGAQKVYVKFKDKDGKFSEPLFDSIFLDTTAAPTGKIEIVSTKDNYIKSSTVKINITASGDTRRIIIGNDANFTGKSWESIPENVLKASTTQLVFSKDAYNLSSGDGKKTVYTRFEDSLGSKSRVYYDDVILDTTGPTGKITINDGNDITSSTKVSVKLESKDAKYFMMSESNNFDGKTWEKYVSKKEFILSSGDGEKSVYVKFRDAAENEGELCSDKIILKTAGPTQGSIKINSDYPETNTPEVTLSISADGAKEMYISNSVIIDTKKLTGGKWEPYTDSKTWTLLRGDGEKTVYIVFRDQLGNMSNPYSDKIILDSDSVPTGKIIINKDLKYTNSKTVDLEIIKSNDAVKMIIGNDKAFANRQWEDVKGMYNGWNLSDGNGVKTVYVQFKDSRGYQSNIFSDTITLDTVKPAGTVLINNDAVDTNKIDVSLKLTYDRDVKEMIISNSNDFSNLWVPVKPSITHKLTSGDGPKTVYIKFRDLAENVSEVYKDEITLNTTAPTGSISINNGDEICTSNVANLTFNVPNAVKMIISNNENINYDEWENYSQSKKWYLSSNDGKKTVYAVFKDNLGNKSQVFSDSIFMDTKTAPTGSIVINEGSASVNSMKVKLTIKASEDAKEMMISNEKLFKDTVWEEFKQEKEWTLSDTAGNKVVYIKFRDSNKVESKVYYDSIKLDISGPAGSISINNDNALTNSTKVTLYIKASDAKQILVSNYKDFSDAKWVDIPTNKKLSFELTTGDDVKIVYAKFKDSLGNESLVFADAITLSTK